MTFVRTLKKSVWVLLILLIAILALSPRAYANNDGVRSEGAAVSDMGTSRPFGRLLDGQYTLNVMLDGQGPFVFMVDTGASRTSIFEATRLRLGHEKRSVEQRFVRGMTSSEIRPTVVLKRLEFIGKAVENHNVIVLENWDDQTETLDGILGMDVLNGLIFAFDHSQGDVGQKRKLGMVRVLKDRALQSRKYRKWTHIKLAENPYPVSKFGLMFTHTLVGDLRIPTLFDMGASFTAISWDIVEGTPLRKEKKRLRDDWEVHGAVGVFKPRIRIIMERIDIGGMPLTAHEILVMNFEGLPINNQGKYPLVITGVDLLGGHDFVLDMQTWQVILDVKPKRKRRQEIRNPLIAFPPSTLPL